eukprot:scaffold7822_cov179-Ochromonas_danica.AAC.9
MPECTTQIQIWRPGILAYPLSLLLLPHRHHHGIMTLLSSFPNTLHHIDCSASTPRCSKCGASSFERACPYLSDLVEAERMKAEAERIKADMERMKHSSVPHPLSCVPPPPGRSDRDTPAQSLKHHTWSSEAWMQNNQCDAAVMMSLYPRAENPITLIMLLIVCLVSVFAGIAVALISVTNIKAAAIPANTETSQTKITRTNLLSSSVSNKLAPQVNQVVGKVELRAHVQQAEKTLLNYCNLVVKHKIYPNEDAADTLAGGRLAEMYFGSQSLESSGGTDEASFDIIDCHGSLMITTVG